MKSRRFLPIALCVVLACVVLVLRPWTVRPLDETGRAVVGPARFDLEAFVAMVWTERLPGAVAAAGPVSAADSTARFVRGEGVVTAVDTRSRVGAAMLDLTPQDGSPDVTLLVGPVVTGSALRDALGLAFGDFDTQVDFANVSTRLNARALAAIPALAASDQLTGRRVAFVGAGVAQPQGVLVTPVELTVAP